MKLLAIILLLATLGLGFYLGFCHWKGRSISKRLSLTHASFGWMALVFILLNLALHDGNLWIAGALFLLLLTFMVGLAMLTLHILRKKRPLWLITIHALMALTGVANASAIR